MTDNELIKAVADYCEESGHLQAAAQQAIREATAAKDAKLAEQDNLIKGIGGEMKETLYMLRTGATNEQLDYRVRNALAQYGFALFDAR